MESTLAVIRTNLPKARAPFSTSPTVCHLLGSDTWRSLSSTARSSSIPWSIPNLYSIIILTPAASHSWESLEEFFSSLLSSFKFVCACLEILHFLEISLCVDFHPLVCVFSSYRGLAVQPSWAHGSPPNSLRQPACTLELFPCETWPPCSTFAMGKEQLT